MVISGGPGGSVLWLAWWCRLLWGLGVLVWFRLHLRSGLPGLAHWAKLSSVCFWISSARAWPGTGDLYSHLGMKCLGFRGLGVLPRGRGCPFWTLLSKGPRFRNSQIVKESRHHLSLQSFHRLNFLFPLPWFPRALVFSRSLLPLHEAGMGSWKA